MWGVVCRFVAVGIWLTACLGTSVLADCCQPPSRGNLDQSADGQVDLADLTVLIDHLFISLTAPSCWEEGNLDGSLPEGPGSVTLGDLTVMMDHLFISLAELSACPDPTSPPSGSVVSYSECKSYGTRDDVGPNEDCLVWRYDGSTLVIDQINAGFNCCPVILATIEIASTDIVITQIDSLYQGGCDCLCLYDVHYEITNLPVASYHVRIYEPYLLSPDPPLDVVIDLTSESSGTYCESRTMYPWGEF